MSSMHSGQNDRDMDGTAGTGEGPAWNKVKKAFYKFGSKTRRLLSCFRRQNNAESEEGVESNQTDNRLTTSPDTSVVKQDIKSRDDSIFSESEEGSELFDDRKRFKHRLPQDEPAPSSVIEQGIVQRMAVVLAPHFYGDLGVTETPVGQRLQEDRRSSSITSE